MKKLAPLALLAACGGTPTALPAIPPVDACQIIDPTALSGQVQDAGLPPPKAKNTQTGPGPGLARLLPGAGPGTGLPMSVPQLLSMPEAPTEAQWRALPPTADAVLSQVAADDDAGIPQRARAVSGLAARKAEGAGPQIAALLADQRLDPTLRRTAARALGDVYVASGPGGGDEAHVVINTLEDTDALTREAAVKALAPHVGRADVRAALEARLLKEEDALVKEALTQALAPKEP
jgi:hypothetical protein